MALSVLIKPLLVNAIRLSYGSYVGPNNFHLQGYHHLIEKGQRVFKNWRQKFLLIFYIFNRIPRASLTQIEQHWHETFSLAITTHACTIFSWIHLCLDDSLGISKVSSFWLPLLLLLVTFKVFGRRKIILIPLYLYLLEYFCQKEQLWYLKIISTCIIEQKWSFID